VRLIKCVSRLDDSRDTDRRVDDAMVATPAGVAKPIAALTLTAARPSPRPGAAVNGTPPAQG